MLIEKNIWDKKKLINVLKNGGVVVMPTDTIYGIVGSALNEETVFRVYETRKRNPEKPCIILIGDISELEKFYITLSIEQKNKLALFQDQPTSFILDCSDDLSAQAGRFSYLHRGTKTLAFRLPASKELRELLLKTGPLIAPSANPEGLPPAENIVKAKEYFSKSVDLYIDGGEISGKASRIIKLNENGIVQILRD